MGSNYARPSAAACRPGFWRSMPAPSIPKIEDILVARDLARAGRSLRTIEL
jgi:hypothetical protein